MKKFLFFVAILMGVILNVELANTKETKFHFTISLYLMEDGQKKLPEGEASFTVAEKVLGHAGFIYFKGGERLTLTGGNHLIPVLNSMNATEPPLDWNEVFLSGDLYSLASLTEDKLIKVEGILNKSIFNETEGSGRYGFNFNIEKINFILPDNGKQTILINDNYYGKKIYLDLSVSIEGEKVYKKRTTRNVSFNTEYYLYNLDTQKYELEGSDCVLGLGLDTPDGKVTCLKNKVFKLPGGDSLLYLSAFEIKNAAFSEPNKIKFQLEVSHLYAKNPKFGHSHVTELKSDRTTVVLFNKEITSVIGERTEIEIPQDKDSQLPFKSRETIVLINSVKEVKE